ncbi:hypothetical protein [Zestomonas carbonaria]|uniref:Flagellar protein FliT n=1 Tax=Zestomonas carbonaria TaxID=2762745 RepID=A0A7U7ESU3_9GAMM|nr:hypothetical protein [Pseudomonas carbonaria]CAD5110218.1 hypothetical protein PSEWESI4_04536 [Pseudomonas carbonaria]
MRPVVAESQALYRRLADVLEKRDWERLGEVDQAIRAHLQRLAGLGEPDAELLGAKRRLQQLHGRARVACAEECERLRRLLLTHLEYAEGRSAYMQVDLMQGGR